MKKILSVIIFLLLLFSCFSLVGGGKNVISTCDTYNLSNSYMFVSRIIFVDDDWLDQGDVDEYDLTLIWQYNAFNRIQDGIDVAYDRDSVFVFNGLYQENIIIDKSINLIGENRTNTFIDGCQTGDVVKIVSNRTNIYNFSIFNGKISEWPYYSGINIENTNISIINNDIYNNMYGIYSKLDKIDNITIKNNYIYYNTEDGILLNNVVLSIFEDNYCMFNNDSGIEIDDGSDNTIYNNHCLYNMLNGIEIYSGNHVSDFCSNNLIKNNTCHNNMKGIQIGGFHSYSNKIIGNRCNNNMQGIVIIESSEYDIIQDNICSNNTHGIVLTNSVSHCNISDNSCYKNSIGMYLLRTYYCNVENNQINRNSLYGLLLKNSYGNIIYCNTIGPLNWHGIFIHGSTDTKIRYNDIVNNNGIGIFIYVSSTNIIADLLGLNVNRINFNNIYGNTEYGLAGVDCWDNVCFNYWGNNGPNIFKKSDKIVGKDGIIFLGIIKIWPWLKNPVETAIISSIGTQYETKYR